MKRHLCLPANRRVAERLSALLPAHCGRGVARQAANCVWALGSLGAKPPRHALDAVASSIVEGRLQFVHKNVGTRT